MNNKYRNSLLIILLFTLLASSCSGPASTAEPTLAPAATETLPPLSETLVMIDGKEEDWEKYPSVAFDESGDSQVGTFDLEELRAFVNTEYLYIMVKGYDNGPFDHITFQIGAKNGFSYQLNVWPGRFAEFKKGGSLQEINAISSWSDVIEIKIALSELEIEPEAIHDLETNCGAVADCDRGDHMEAGNIVSVAEREPEEQLVSLPTTPSDARFPKPYFGNIGSDAEAEYFDKSPITQPAEIAWGPDGYLYICSFSTTEFVKVSPEGEVTPLELWKTQSIFQYDGPKAITFDDSGTMYLANHSQAVKVSPTGELEIIPGVQGSPIGDIEFGPDGSLYFTNRNEEGGVYRLPSLESTGAEKIATLPYAEDMIFSADGYLYVGQMNLGVVKINLETKEIRPFTPESQDQKFMAIDKEGDIWIKGQGWLRQYSSDGEEKPYEMRLGDEIISGEQFNWHTESGIAFDPDGNLWVAAFISVLWKLEPTDPEQVDPDFIFTDVVESMRVAGMDFGPNGELYVFDENTENLYRYSPEGEKELLYDFGNVPGPGRGPGTVAVDPNGIVYAGVWGSIYRFDESFNPEVFAEEQTYSMVFGKDGGLYALQGGYGTNYSLVRISSNGEAEFVLDSIDGHKLGPWIALIARYGDEGFIIHDFSTYTIYFVDYEGNGRIIAQNFYDNAIGALAVSPTTNDIFFLGQPTIFRIDAESGEAIPIVGGAMGDAISMVVSPDGKWIYFAPNGAIGRIPISE